MLPLPILNVRLNACHEDWQQMTPVAQGQHCSQCNRVVMDFTKGTQADLEAAFQNSPDGRVCGRFRQSQLAPKPQLRPKLRRFLVALVLVCGLGLTSGEAWAQVQKGTHKVVGHKPNQPLAKEVSKATPKPEAVFFEIGLVGEPAPNPDAHQVYTNVGQMPVYKDGGAQALPLFIKNNLRWPKEAAEVEGRVFVAFVIDKAGGVRDAKVVKGLHPALNIEALRLVQLLNGQFTPGRQNNRPVDVHYTLPITFKRN
ncbi:energy transducer TonB [Hymenobacter sp.]|uniref:energy transducer TonB n=1 Tax=Hymenobacter sp. TaxID=1898978 RepID=UPI002ED920AF